MNFDPLTGIVYSNTSYVTPINPYYNQSLNMPCIAPINPYIAPSNLYIAPLNQSYVVPINDIQPIMPTPYNPYYNSALNYPYCNPISNLNPFSVFNR